MHRYETMRHQRLDLNLLVALDSLLRTASVTEAASQVHVSQPSMSGSLSRLRKHFNDPLLIKSGRKLRLSPLAIRLRGTVREAMQHIDRAISMRPTFDPSIDARRFNLSASDFTVLVLGSPLVRQLCDVAPHTSIQWLAGSPLEMGQKLHSGDLDLTFVAEPFVDPAFPRRLVIEDEYSCITWSENEATQFGLTKKNFSELGHVETHYGPQSTPGASHRVSTGLGIERRVEAICTSPILLGAMVAGTQRIATVAHSLALALAKGHALRIFPHPWDLPPARIFMQWNQDREGDGAVDWLRGTVTEVADVLGRRTMEAEHFNLRGS